MKKTISGLCILSVMLLKAQLNVPFNWVTLVRQTSNQTPQDSILPTYRNGAFVYINQKNGQPLFNKKFKEAYPFYGKSALVFDMETNSYNAIDCNGNLLVNKGMFHRINNPTTCDKGFVSFSSDPNETRTEFIYDVFNAYLTNQCRASYCAYPVPFKSPFLKTQSGQYLLNIRGGNSILFDKVESLGDNMFLTLKDQKLGIIRSTGESLVPLEFEESTIDFTGKKEEIFVNIIPLKKENIWYYYEPKGKLITQSPMKCQTLLYGQPKLGIYKNGQKYGILYTDGTTLQKEYDWISEDGLLARTGNDFYFIFDKDIIPYYVKN